MKTQDWKTRPAVSGAAPAGPQTPDMALAALRLVLIKQCGVVATQMGPIAQHLEVVGENLAAYVRSVPSMPEAEVHAGLQAVAKIVVALKALGRLGLTWPSAVAGDGKETVVEYN